jgi:hypothetical protein
MSLSSSRHRNDAAGGGGVTVWQWRLTSGLTNRVNDTTDKPCQSSSASCRFGYLKRHRAAAVFQQLLTFATVLCQVLLRGSSVVARIRLRASVVGSHHDGRLDAEPEPERRP